MANFTINIGEQNINENNILGENVSKGDLLYLSTDGKYYKANASSKTTSTTELRLAETNGLINEEISLLAFGNFEFDLPMLVSGTKYYVSITNGQITSTLYTNTNNIVRYIGTAYSNTILVFNPDQTYISDNGFRVNDIPVKSSLQAHTHLESDISDLDKYTQAEVDFKIQSHLTYANIITALGFTPENVANKVTNFSNPTNNNYPSTLAVVNYIASQVLSFYEHIQSTPATTWNISHNLGKKPSVTIQDNFGNNVIADVTYVNNNNLTINFITSVEGSAYLT